MTGREINAKQQPVTLREMPPGDTGLEKQSAQSHASQVGAGCHPTSATSSFWGLGWPV